MAGCFLMYEWNGFSICARTHRHENQSLREETSATRGDARDTAALVVVTPPVMRAAARRARERAEEAAAAVRACSDTSTSARRTVMLICGAFTAK